MLDCFNKKWKHSDALACKLNYGNSDRTSILLVQLYPQHLLFWLLYFILFYIADNMIKLHLSFLRFIENAVNNNIANTEMVNIDNCHSKTRKDKMGSSIEPRHLRLPHLL